MYRCVVNDSLSHLPAPGSNPLHTTPYLLAVSFGSSLGNVYSIPFHSLQSSMIPSQNSPTRSCAECSYPSSKSAVAPAPRLSRAKSLAPLRRLDRQDRSINCPGGRLNSHSTTLRPTGGFLIRNGFGATSFLGSCEHFLGGCFCWTCLGGVVLLWSG